MSEIVDDLPDDGDAALAMDFALGTLEGPELRAAELRLRRDPAFARAVAEWQERLAPLADDVAPVTPPPSVWAAVEAELFRGPAAPKAEAPRRGLWASLGLWQSLTAGTSVVAAVALGILATRPDDGRRRVAPVGTSAPAGANLLAASMKSSDKSGSVVLTATYDPDRGAVTLTPAADSAKHGLTPQLWVIVGKEAPRSLGMIDLQGTQAHPIPEDVRPKLKSGATLAISLEPPGGSPTGAPTGPIVATGKLTAL